MKDVWGNIWVKRCVAIFNVTYVAVVLLFTIATFWYDLVFVDSKLAVFTVIYAVAAIVFLLLMIYTRDIFVTKVLSVIQLPIVFCLLLFNIGNGNWVLIIPPFIVAITMFFAAATNETIKVILGTIYLLLYVLGIVAYVVCNTLLGSSDVETVLNYELDTGSTVYSYYANDFDHLIEVTDDKNEISPDGQYRFYITDVKDNDKGAVKIYIVPYGNDINLKFFSLNEKGISQTVLANGTRGVVPDVGWTYTEEGSLRLVYNLGTSTEWKTTSVRLGEKNYLEFLGL